MVFSKTCNTLFKQRKFRYKNPKKTNLSLLKTKSLKQVKNLEIKRYRRLRKMPFKFKYNTKQLLKILHKLKQNNKRIPQFTQKKYNLSRPFNGYIVKKYERNYISLPKSRFSLKKQRMRGQFFKTRRRRIIAKVRKRVKNFRMFNRFKKYKKKPIKFKAKLFKLKLKYKFRKNRKKRALDVKRRIAIVK